MIWLQRVWYRLKGCRRPLMSIFRKEDLEAEVNEEILFHLDQAIAANLKAGHDLKEARRLALMDFGGVERYKEQIREAHGGRLVVDLVQDFRLALRHLRKHKRLSFVALLSLTLGIGANSALFSVVKSVLLDPLPFPDPEGLVFVWETRNQGMVDGTVSRGNFRAWRESASTAEGMAAIQRRPFNLTGLEEPIRVNGSNVSSGLLSILGVPLHQGREFVPEEEVPGSTPVCLVSHGFWAEHFGGGSDLREKSVILDGISHAIVGVLPEDFSIPGFQEPTVLTPLVLDPSEPGYQGNHNLIVIARLDQGTDLELAGFEFDRIADGLRERFPEWNEGRGARLRSIHEQTVQPVRQNLLFLFGSVGLVLFMTCVNLAGLFLARTALAEKEMAVRKALGAQRSRLMQPLLLEAFILSSVGGGLGLWLCGAAVKTIRVFGPVGSIPRLSNASVDPAVLGFTCLCALATTLFFGLLPAIRSSRAHVLGALKDLGCQPGLSGQHRIQKAFVIGQVCLSVVLLISSGLLLRTYQSLLQVDLGFEPEGRIAMMVSLPEHKYGEDRSVEMFLDQTLQRVGRTPGVRSAGASIGLPFISLFWRQFATVEGRPAQTLSEVPVVDLSIVSPGFLETLAIPLVRGRPILPTDGAQDRPVAVVNEEYARIHLSGLDPIGQRIRLTPPDGLIQSGQQADRPWYTIVGVAKNVRRRALNTDVQPEVYIPQPQDRANAREFIIVARAEGGVGNLGAALREAVWETDPEQPVAWVTPMEDMYSAALSQPLFNLILVGAFGITGVILALVGVYGLMTNAVTLRTREIGVRLALGARRSDILKQMVGWGGGVALIGLVLGLGMSAVVTRLMGTMLFGISASDFLTYGGTVLCVVSTAGIAAFLPAWRGTQMNPRDALGDE